MKIVFLSNYFNHHQKPLSDELYTILGDGYNFIETTDMPKERKALGYSDADKPSYLKQYYTEGDTCQSLIDFADFVIVGSAPYGLFESRLNNNKVVFRYSERPLKSGFNLLKFLPRQFTWRKKFDMKKPQYLLCASAYAAHDYNIHGVFKKRALKWGYFTELKEYSDIYSLINKKKENSLLWCGRFIDWKHPEKAIEIARRLNSDGIEFVLNFIGVGEMDTVLKEMVSKYDLSNVNFLGSMSPEKVREHMEQSQIFLFTSDRNEGWGAVLNEAMNSACVVVADRHIGSVPYLMKDEINGLVFNGKIDELYQCVKRVLLNHEERKQMSINAYNTIQQTWNAKVAAERLINVLKTYDGKKFDFNLYEQGPCSKA